MLLRIATLEGVQPAALRDLNDVLTQLLDRQRQAQEERDGRRRRRPRRSSTSWAASRGLGHAYIREVDPDLAQKIQDKMFVFENLLDLDDRGIQLLLREVQSETLIVALKGTSEPLQGEDLQEHVQRAAEMLREDLEAKGPVRLSEVETEQKEILKIVRRLADEGQIVLGGKGDEGLVE